MDWAQDLVVAAPSAAAVIVVVSMFLRFLREERGSRDQNQKITNEVLEKLRDSIQAMTLKMR